MTVESEAVQDAVQQMAEQAEDLRSNIASLIFDAVPMAVDGMRFRYAERAADSVIAHFTLIPKGSA